MAVGPPTLASVIRLANWDDGNYRIQDEDDPKIGMPRGEVLIGGPVVCAGYYVKDEENPDDADLEMMEK